MKTNFLKHLTALVFLFCLTLSARATISHSITLGTLTITGSSDDVLTYDYVLSNIWGKEYTYSTLEVKGIKKIDDRAFSIIGSAYTKTVRLENVANVGSKIFGETGRVENLYIIGDADKCCNLQYDSFASSVLVNVHINYPVTTTIYTEGTKNEQKGAFSDLKNVVEQFSFNCPVIPEGLCFNLSIKELVIGSGVKTVNRAFTSKSSSSNSYGVPEIETIRISAATDAIDLDKLLCSNVHNLIIARPINNLTRIYSYDPIVTIEGDFAFNGINFVSDKTKNIKKLTINNPSFLATSNDFTTANNVATKFDKLESLVIGDNITTIGNNAFAGSTTLKEVTLGKGVTDIYKTAFNTCSSLTKVRINGDALTRQSYQEQDNIAERFPSLEELTFGPDVTMVGHDMFNVDMYSFGHGQDYSLQKVTFLSDQSIAVDAYAFYGCNKLSTIEGDIMSVAAGSFAYTNLSKIKIIDDTAIEYGAFQGCSSLAEVEIPASVTSIAKYAFADCPNLKNVICNVATPITITEDVFSGVPVAEAELEVPYSSFAAYKSAEVWKDFGSYFATDGIKLVDGVAYTNDEDQEVPMVRYTRSFSQTQVDKWQALYIPFSMKYEDWCENFEVARLNDVHQYDDNGDGNVDRTTLEYIKVKTGSILANRPYIIKALTPGEKTIEVENTTLMAAESNSIDCSSFETLYTITGIYEPTPFDAFTVYACDPNGSLQQGNQRLTLGAYRWYLEITDRNTGSSISDARIRINIEGEEDETSIQSIHDNMGGKVLVHSLDGKIVKILSSTDNLINSNLPAGMYIINGKKIQKL